jgi:hypothetical protein
MGYLHGHKPLWKGKSDKDVLAEDFFLSDDGMDTGTSSCFFFGKSKHDENSHKECNY